jgi:signal transduction histidine kinase
MDLARRLFAQPPMRRLLDKLVPNQDYIGYDTPVTPARELAERGAPLRCVAEIGELLAEATDLEAALPEALRRAVPRLADAIYLRVAAPRGGVRHFCAAPTKAAGEALRECAEARAAEVFKPGGAATAHLAREPPRRAALAGVRPSGYLAVPVSAQGEALGVLCVARLGGELGGEGRAAAAALARGVALAAAAARHRAAAQAAWRARDDALAVTSHELKGPLSTLKLALHLMRTALRDLRGEELAARLSLLVGPADQQVERMTALIHDLLDVTRIRAGHAAAPADELELAPLLAAIAAESEPDLARSGCTLAVRAGAVRGRWDRRLLEQSVRNLLSNAIKYGARGAIELGASAEGAVARVWVRDSGPGIPPERLAALFERFERAGAAPSRESHGLGLWITRHFVEALGGTVAAASPPGGGALFTLELPLSYASRGAEAAGDSR